MTRLREGLPPLPDRMKSLPLDARGYPVPWFVAFIDGVADFRVIRENGIAHAYNKKLCWICGHVRGAIGAFVIGPMCAVNRVSAEPPAHLECAMYAAKACPFLTLPKAHRREAGIPADAKDPAGVMIARNPGVALVWTSRTWKPFKIDSTGAAGAGVLFDIGEPIEARWYAEGRRATRAEVMASLESGLPLLQREAAKEAGGSAALTHQLRKALQVVPKE
jgi:hypothetical protein